MRIRILSCALVGLALLGCGSDSDDTSKSGTGGTSGAGGTSGSGGAAGGVAGVSALAAPQIDMVMPMAPAGLHISWTNAQPNCDEVEGERKSAAEPYAVVFSVPGEADNEHDATATGLVEYTYRLRCQKAGEYSLYSNEMSGTPE